MLEVLLGVITGAAIPLLKDLLAGRRAEKLERIKLHDLQRLKAYQAAYKFSSTLRNSLKDTSQATDLAFFNKCVKDLYLIIEDLPYYSENLRTKFIELEDVMESIMDNMMDKEVNSSLVKDKVMPLSVLLRDEIVLELKMWN